MRFGGSGSHEIKAKNNPLSELIEGGGESCISKVICSFLVIALSELLPFD